VQIVEEGTPPRVVVEDGVGEPDELTTTLRDHRVLVQARRSKTARPDLATIGDDVSVKVGVPERTAIVTPPTLRMESADIAGVPLRRLPVRHSSRGPLFCVVDSNHASLLIDPGIGTVPEAGCRTVKGPGPSGHSG
jgi:hypothetical protein